MIVKRNYIHYYGLNFFQNEEPNLNYLLLNSVIFHRNQKSEMFVMNDSLNTLLQANLDLTSKPFDTAHLSVKPSCELCELSVKIIQLYDPVGDVINVCHAVFQLNMYFVLNA